MKTVTAAVIDSNPTEYEEQHVHAVYDQIASHFSSTRYKARKSSLEETDSPLLILLLAMAHYRQLSCFAAHRLGWP